MSPYADWFVGGVSIAIGTGALWGAASANASIFSMPKVRLLEASLGKSGTRALLAAVGLLLIVLGVAIGVGWKWKWFSEPQEKIVVLAYAVSPSINLQQ
jgi:hypothetical protein